MRTVKCNSNTCIYSKEGECNCKDLVIHEHEYYDMNPYDVEINRSCISYRKN